MDRRDREVREEATGQGGRGARTPQTVLRLGAPRAWALIAALVALGVVLLSSGTARAAGTLPDERAWELVSPTEKDGASITPLGFGIFGPIGGMVQSSEDGNSVTYVADAPVESEPEGNRAIEGTQVFSQRTPGSWASKDIVTPHNNGEGLLAGTPQEYRLFSSDLSLGMLEPFSRRPLMEPPLVPGASSEELSLYRRHNFNCQASPVTCYEPIVSAEDVSGTEEGKATAFGGKLEYLSATPDLAHVVLKSVAKLTADAPAEGGLYEWSSGAEAAERLQYISRLPPPVTKPTAQGKPAPEARLGNDEEGVYENARYAISRDGRRVFWIENKEGSRSRLYMRDTQTRTTMLVNETFDHKKPTAHNEVRFQIASADGSKVFFLDNAPLTEDSKLKTTENGPTDLYVCEVVEVAGKPECKLTDLTASFAGPGAVAGEVLGASTDGSTLFFVANGANEASEQGECEIPGAPEEKPSATCNLYVERNVAGKWEPPKLVAKLSEEDHPDWGGGFAAGHYLWNLTARVSPSGQYLAFMSNRPLTNYDNRDANPAAAEARDEEVFLYDANAEKEALHCVSCNPNPAQRPTGVLDQKFAGEGQNLRVDPVAAWEGKWLAGSIPGWTPISPEEAPYQARYLLDNGRLFFNSADRLVPGQAKRRPETVGGTPTEVGVENVYEYEPRGLGACESVSCVGLLSSGESAQESAFMDASASGNDAFFVTAQPLVSTDPDGNFDIYDARVCSAGSPCIVPPSPPASPCGDEASCRSGTSTSQSFGSTGSEAPRTPSVVGQVQALPFKKTVPASKPLTRAQRLARALASCRKRYKHSKHKRATCERQARKSFGSKHKAHKK